MSIIPMQALSYLGEVMSIINDVRQKKNPFAADIPNVELNFDVTVEEEAKIERLTGQVWLFFG